MDSNGADIGPEPVAPDARPATGRRTASATAPMASTAADHVPTRTLPTRPTGTRRRTSRPKPAAASRNWLRTGLRITVVLLVLLSALTTIVGFRLWHGPISLAIFKSLIETSVNAELGGQQFHMKDVALVLGADGLDLELTDVRISDVAGAPLVQAPRAVVGLSGRAALGGRLGFSRIDLVNPRLQVFYTDDGTLSVKFAQVAEPSGADVAARSAVPDIASPPASAGLPADSGGAIDFVKAITDISAQARRREHVTAFLREIGLQQATLIIDNGRRKTIWRVPELKIDLRHKANSSLIEGRAVIDSLTGPWSLNFHTAEAAAAQQLVVLAKVAGINPRGLSRQVPALAHFEQADVPLDGEARFELSSKGIVSSATFALTARAGQLLVPAGQGRFRPATVEMASIKGSYDAASSQFAFSEASLSVDHNRLDLTGTATRAPTPASNGLPLWNFALVSTGGALAPLLPDGPPIAIDGFHVRGQLVPEAGSLLLQEIALKAGGAAIVATGSVSDLATDANRSADLEARIAPMPIMGLLAVWPPALAPEARGWLAAHVTKGQLSGGVIRLASGGENRVSLSLEVANGEVSAIRGLPALEFPRGLVRLEGGGLEITVPEAAIGATGRRVLLKGLRVTAIDTADGSAPVAEIAFRLQGSVAAAVDLADREPLRLLKSRGVVLHTPEGRLDGQFKVTLPVSDDLQLSDVRVQGRLKLLDGRLRQAIGAHDVTGAKFDIDISETAVDARGDFLFKGIPVKVAGQHFLNTTPDRQSPFRLSLKLDDADRAQLGLDINDLVAGEVPIEVLVGLDAKGDVQAHLNADLTKAELTLDSVAYRKPPGSPARLQFDPAKAAGGRVELRNFKIAGQSIAAEGIITLGPDGKARELSFPEFSLNTVSRLEIQGLLRADHVWDVRAKGATFDGRDLFRDLFDVQAHAKTVPKDKPGLDLTADIDTVLGFSDTNLKSVRLSLQKRSSNGIEKTTILDLAAKHETGKSFEAHIRGAASGDRKLTASSQDAGQTFKVVGFYPNAAGGHMSLEVVLDGRGAVERNGVLRAENFAVFGDPVISEVFQNGDGAGSASQRSARRKTVRERIEFDWMVLPFAVGSGQFVMNDVEIRGPLVGARVRGKADFASQRLQIGGTYIPLSGLNSALGGLPVLGQLLAGPKGEGIFGITFVVQGPMANPEVLVNPFSGFFPGLTRETQQMAPESFKITPRIEPPAPVPAKGAAKASSAAPTSAAPAATAAAGAPTDVISDWSNAPPAEPKPRAKAAQP